MQIFWGALAVLLVFGLVVCFHELGHFLMAKWCGIGVERFSLGFPPRLFGRQIGETDYCVGAIPLGGFVKLQGMADDESAVLLSAPGAPQPDPERSFDSHPRWQRMLVMSGGVIFNFILAFLIYAGAKVIPHHVSLAESAPAYIISVEPGSAADKAGLKSGDQILSMDGVATPTVAEVYLHAHLNNRGSYPIRFSRHGVERETIAEPKIIQSDNGEKYGQLGIGLPAQVFNTPAAGSPAAAGGIRRGDVFVELEEPGPASSRQQDPLADPRLAAVRFKLMRNGEMLTVTISRSSAEDWGFRFTERQRLGIDQAVRHAMSEITGQFSLTFQLFRKMFSGRTSARTMSGPVGIFRMIGTIRPDHGMLDFAANLIGIAAAISVQLGIMNLLPIPVLDGGHITVLLLESATRRDFNRRLKERLILAGFYLLLGLVVVLTISDVLKLFHH